MNSAAGLYEPHEGWLAKKRHVAKEGLADGWQDVRTRIAMRKFNDSVVVCVPTVTIVKLAPALLDIKYVSLVKWTHK